MGVGSGDNGKSIEFGIIAKILGYKNITTLSLQDLTNNLFSRAESYQKLAIISDDIPSTAISSTGILKSLSSGSRINAQRKHGHPFDFDNYAKLSFALNNPPKIKDDTASIWSRLKVVKYQNQFNVKPNYEKGEMLGLDKDLIIKTLEKEIPGIINWMLEGLKRLIKNGYKFSYNQGTEEMRDYWRKKSDPCISWLDECLIETGNELSDYVLKTNVYPHFKKWCKENEIKTIPTSKDLFAEFKDAGLDGIQPWNMDLKVKEERRYFGYNLKELTTVRSDVQGKSIFSAVEKSKLYIFIKGGRNKKVNTGKQSKDYPEHVNTEAQKRCNDCQKELSGVSYQPKGISKIVCRECRERYDSKK